MFKDVQANLRNMENILRILSSKLKIRNNDWVFVLTFRLQYSSQNLKCKNVVKVAFRQDGQILHLLN